MKYVHSFAVICFVGVMISWNLRGLMSLHDDSPVTQSFDVFFDVRPNKRHNSWHVFYILKCNRLKYKTLMDGNISGY